MPAVGSGLDKLGFVVMLIGTNVVAILYNSLQLVSNLELQSATFVLLSIFRVSIFCNMFAFIQHEFGPQSFGRLTGAMMMISSIVSFSVPGFLYLVNHRLDGDFLYMNLAFALSVLPVFLTPYYLWRRSRVVVPHPLDSAKQDP